GIHERTKGHTPHRRILPRATATQHGDAWRAREACEGETDRTQPIPERAPEPDDDLHAITAPAPEPRAGARAAAPPCGRPPQRRARAPRRSPAGGDRGSRRSP